LLIDLRDESDAEHCPGGLKWPPSIWRKTIADTCQAAILIQRKKNTARSRRKKRAEAINEQLGLSRAILTIIYKKANATNYPSLLRPFPSTPGLAGLRLLAVAVLPRKKFLREGGFATLRETGEQWDENIQSFYQRDCCAGSTDVDPLTLAIETKISGYAIKMHLAKHMVNEVPRWKKPVLGGRQI